jgi:hypothetical protein
VDKEYLMANASLLEMPRSGQTVNGKIPAFTAHRSRTELKAMGKALREKCPKGPTLWPGLFAIG